MILSFQTRIALLVSAGLLPLLVFGAWVGRAARDQVRAHIHEDVRSAARDATVPWRATVAEARAMVALLAADEDLAGPACGEVLERAARASRGVSLLLVADVAGSVLCASEPTEAVVPGWAPPAATAPDRLFSLRGPDGPAAALVHLLPTAQDAPARWLVARLALDAADAQLRLDGVPVTAGRMLLSPEGEVLVRSPAFAAADGADAAALGIPTELLRAEAGFRPDVSLGGAPHLLVALPTWGGQGTPEGHVVVAVPTLTAEAPAERFRDQLLVSGWIAVFAVLLSLGVAANRLLVRRMESLVARAERLAWPEGRPDASPDAFLLLGEAVQSLAERAERVGAPFRRAVDVAAEGVLVASPTGRVVLANPAATRLLGLRQDQLLGGDLHGLLHPDADHGPEACPLLAPARDGRSRHASRANLPRGRGGVFSGRWAAHPVEDGTASAGILVVFEDRSTERELEGRLRQAARLEALGLLVGSVAHDFNNLLTAMLGYADLLSERVDGEEDRRDVEEIIRAAQRATGLSQQILALSRGRGDGGPVDVNVACREMERLLARLVGERVTLRVDLDPSAGFVAADAGQVEQLLLNLVVNARDALPPTGGRIEIRTRRHADRGLVALSVSDDGVGIPEEARARLFEPFYTTKEHGTGLGLTTVARILGEVSGQIEVESNPGAGTTFRAWLPVADPERSTPVATPEPDRRGTARVWVVEDDEAVRSFAARALRARGYRVWEYATAEAVLDALPRAAELPEVLVTDLGLPGMGGEELARLARERVPGLRVVFLTGYDRREMDDPLVRKPFTGRELAAATARAVDRAPG